MTSVTPQLSKELKNAAISILDQHKAERIVDIDLAGKTDIADYMVIATAQSGRHASALADYIKRFFKDHEADIMPSVEGGQTGDWVLVDAGCIIFHIFRREIREHYNLEGMWNAPSSSEDASASA